MATLPPGFLDELRSRISITDVAGRKVTWDNRKSNPGKGDMWAPCPFHDEKTASFHVDDKKGFFYCFGCHEKGNAISFVQKTENISFMEAVETLAGQVGMEVPKLTPQAQQQADHFSQLVDVMEMALRHFQLQLKTGAAAHAREYLARRGLDETAQDRWEIGYAPRQWAGLLEALKNKGVDQGLILEAGLARHSDKRQDPYDVFRDRIIFPIRDVRGRCIAFGGRALDADAPAKYLNSPETPLFDKSKTLFNIAPARKAMGKNATLIVAEGYMDVIALSEFGFHAAVAPLGTAITETQLQMLWRLSQEPVIALDGDKAGLRAAMRLIDLALPLLTPEKSLRFALMPNDQDPDDLLRDAGAGAMQDKLDHSISILELMWREETEGRLLDSPERKAALENALRMRVSKISDQVLRQHFERSLREMLWQRLRNQQRTDNLRGARNGRSWQRPSSLPSTKTSLLVGAADDRVTQRLSEQLVLAGLLKAPELCIEFETELMGLRCEHSEESEIRDVLMRFMPPLSQEARQAIEEKIRPETLDKVMGARHVAIHPHLRDPIEIEKIRQLLRSELAKLHAARGLDAELAEALDDFERSDDERLTWRLAQAASAAKANKQGSSEQAPEFEIGKNGARIQKDEKDAFEDLMGKISFEKRKR